MCCGGGGEGGERDGTGRAVRVMDVEGWEGAWVSEGMKVVDRPRRGKRLGQGVGDEGDGGVMEAVVEVDGWGRIAMHGGRGSLFEN